MIRILVFVIIVAIAAATGFSQKKRTPEPRYRVVKGRCENLYFLENAPEFFDKPETKDEIEVVVRILKSAPPESDVKCRDFTDAWSPYLYAHRKVRIARLLIQLKKYDEAREELWSIFSSRPLIFKKNRLYYEFGTEEAVELIVGQELWNAEDIARRLKSAHYTGTGDIKKAYQERLRRRK